MLCKRLSTRAGQDALAVRRQPLRGAAPVGAERCSLSSPSAWVENLNVIGLLCFKLVVDINTLRLLFSLFCDWNKKPLNKMPFFFESCFY